MCEEVLKNMFMEKMNDYFSPFVAVYRENCSTLHVVIRLVGAVMAHVSKACDCILHDLLIAKLAAYGLGNYLIHCVYSCLKNRKQCVKYITIGTMRRGPSRYYIRGHLQISC